MSTFLQVMGGLFCLSLLLGGAWIGACWAVDRWKAHKRYRRMLRIADLCERDIRRDALRRIHQRDAVAKRRLQEAGASSRGERPQ